MKALKYAIVTAILALGLAAPVVIAQDSDSAAPAKAKRGGSHDMTATWLKGITLTADQQTKVDAIKADVKTQVAAAAGDRTKLAAISKDAKAKVRAVLTDDQKTTFDTNTASKGGKGSDKGASKKSKKSKGGEGGGGGDE